MGNSETASKYRRWYVGICLVQAPDQGYICKQRLGTVLDGKSGQNIGPLVTQVAGRSGGIIGTYK
jgi:hypothetical protein